MTYRKLYQDPPSPYGEEKELLQKLAPFGPSLQQRDKAVTLATGLVQAIRQDANPTLMESFLARYRLSSAEGLALMTLAEALLRIPDPATADALIADKIGTGNWQIHQPGKAAWRVRAATQGLVIAKQLIAPQHAAPLRQALSRLGAPVLRQAVRFAMREIGNAFVLGRTITEAWQRGATDRKRGFNHSFDMLGEAAMTENDARAFHDAYSDAITHLAQHSTGDDIRDNAGISVKLSALHPRYQTSQSATIISEVVPRLAALCRQAAAAGIGLNIDAEEANRLELSLALIKETLQDPSLAGWDGFGIVVQAYGKRCPEVLDRIHSLAKNLDRKLMVRLVKGAYWDSEVKQAQIAGTEGFPVFTRKPATDISWLCCAGKLLGMTGHIYPQFATHNAHSAATVLVMAQENGLGPQDYEFQRLHGMGEALFDLLQRQHGCRCRIYAPVGPHKDLLAYLARRMLENGANSSFVSQIADPAIPAAAIACDPWENLTRNAEAPIRTSESLFAPERMNSRGAELQEPATLLPLLQGREAFAKHEWAAGPLLATGTVNATGHKMYSPQDPTRLIGTLAHASPDDIKAAIIAATAWQAPVAERRRIIGKASRLYEENAPELLALLCLEAGKTLPDALAELREAVDFMRYYASQADAIAMDEPLGVVAAISPWNFPLAIFTGQISAALVTGNAVLAKPAEATGLIAFRAVQLLHEAGVPRSALQLVTGTGAQAGAMLGSSPAISGMVFTGSTATAQHIHRNMAEHLSPDARLIAETGGINAMVADSTALPEQIVRDVLASAFQSTGQRCSALRVLYLQDDIAEAVENMLFGAMRQLRTGDPWDPVSDLGPVIDQKAQDRINAHIRTAADEGRLLFRTDCPGAGFFVPATAIRVAGIGDLEEEVFGPVLHIARFPESRLQEVLDEVNNAGYGLTFGLHSRMDGRIRTIAAGMRIGNIYINRNQIGAVVESQPFGGEGLSGTGPKAGGPHYLPAFIRKAGIGNSETGSRSPSDVRPATRSIQQRIDMLQATMSDMPLMTMKMRGPTGEANHLSTYARGVVLCLGPEQSDLEAQIRQIEAAGAAPLPLHPQDFDPESLAHLQGFAAVAYRKPDAFARRLRLALAARNGPIIPLLCEGDITRFCMTERHVSIDTTAAGGNAELLAAPQDFT